ncbi:MAG: DUF58 domain-containing protein [Eubacterium sp.]|nr:DUF58 domain-containing protein [Eubacterium sp.]
MISFIITVFIIADLAYLSLIYESTSLVRLCVAGAMFLVVAIIYLIIRRKKIKCRIDAPIILVDANKKVNLRIMVRNNSRLITDKIKLQLRYSDTKRLRKKWISLYISEYGENEFTVPVMLNNAGYYEFEAYKCHIYDRLGLFYISKRFTSSTGLMVMPEIGDITVRLGERIRNFYGDSDVYDDIRPGRDSSEIFDIREFRDGDKVQRINWKLSAKKNCLLVREDSQPKACPVILFYSVKKIKEKGYRPEVYSKLLGRISSVSFALMDKGCPHFVVWQSESRGTPVRVRVDDEESFFLAVTGAMEDSVYVDYEELRKAYKEKYRSEIYVSEIYSKDDILLLDGEEIPEGELVIN